MKGLKKLILYFLVLIFVVACGAEKTIKNTELPRNMKYNLITLSTVDDLIAALIIESGEFGSIKEIKKNTKWEKIFSDNKMEVFLVKYKNSKVTVPIMKAKKSIFVDVDSIECIGMNVMGENKVVRPIDIGY